MSDSKPRRNWRDFFYKRVDTDDEIRIVYKSYASFMMLEYALCALMLYGFIYRFDWSRPLAVVVAVFAIAIGMIYAPCERLLREAEADGRARTEGKKMSRGKPYTIIVQLRKRKHTTDESLENDG